MTYWNSRVFVCRCSNVTKSMQSAHSALSKARPLSFFRSRSSAFVIILLWNRAYPGT